MNQYAKQLSKGVLILITLIVGLTACHDDEPQLVVPPARTVLAYIVGDNNLSGYAPANVDSMLVGMARGDAANLNLLVYKDNYSGYPTLWKIDVDEAGKAVKTVINSYAEQNSVDKTIMSNIIREVFEQYPADEKGLILWSHGSGWVPSSNYSPTVSRAFGQDDSVDSGSAWLELWDLREVLEQTGIHFDFLLFDACNMANVEVVYELRNVTDYIIASVAEIMGSGFPYCEIINLMAQKKLDLCDIGRAYSNYYDGHNDYFGGTISVIKTERLDELATLYGAVVAADTLTAAQLEELNIQEFGRHVNSLTSYHTYYYDFMQTVNTLGPDKANAIAALLHDIVLYEEHTPTFGFTLNGGDKFTIKTCSGLSVFIPKINPDARLIAAYNQLAWTQATAGSYAF